MEPSAYPRISAATIHFVDGERRIGGHLLDLRRPALTLSVDESHGLNLILPQDPAFLGVDSSDSANASGAYARAVRSR